MFILLLIGIAVSVYSSVKITGINHRMLRVSEQEDPANAMRALDNELSSAKGIAYFGLILMAIGLFL